MSREHDQASDIEQLARDTSLLAARNYESMAKATGKCLNCFKPLKNDMRWCNSACRDDYQRWHPEA